MKRYVTPKKAPRLVIENALFSDGKLICRGGLHPVGDPIFIKDGTFPGETDFTLTDCYLRRNTQMGRVAVITEDNLSDSLMLTFFLIFGDGDRESLGRVVFTRASADSFGKPESFTVFSGAAIKGDGIFLLCRQVYENGEPDFVSVREFSSLSGSWIMLTEDDLYAPLLLSFGRGNGYFLAVHAEQKVSFPAPVFPESENLLCGTFRAEFSSDGASSDFELPLKGLSDEPVSAHFSYMGEEADWTVPAGAEFGNTVNFIGNKVVMVCDRAAGRISFVQENGAAFSLPYCGVANNLSVTAVKRRPKSAVAVASSLSALAAGGAFGGEKNCATFFYGSRLHPSAGFFNHPKHPLYFPESSQFDAGEVVCRAVSTGDGVTLLTREAIFTADKKSEAYLPKDFKKVCDLPLTVVADSLASTGDGLLFLSESGGLYRLYRESLFQISNLGYAPEQGGNALFFEGLYLYAKGKRVLAVQVEGKSAVCGIWNFPVDIAGGLAFGGNFTLLPAFIEGERAIVSPAVLSEGDDLLPAFDGSQIVNVSYPTRAKCRFALFDVSLRPVKLCKLRADGEGRVELSVKSGKKTLLCRKTALMKGRLISAGCVALDPEIEFRFSSDGLLQGLSAEYYEI